MKNKALLLEEITDKWSEYFEMVGDGLSPNLMINILSGMLLESRSETEYYKRRLNERTNTRV